MCWSATADLSAGTAIAAIGIGCLAAAARNRRPRDLPLAAFPLLLGVHQIIESFVWRGTMGDISPGAASTARMLWAAIALPLLPVFVPWAVYLASTPTTTAVRRLLLTLAGIGTATALWLTVTLVQNPVTAEVHGHRLFYGIGIPLVAVPVVGYLIATLGSLLAAPDPAIRLLGVTCTVGALVCIVLWTYAFASTWCALAAVASLVLLRWAMDSRAPSPIEATPLSHC